ncbi:MAG: N-acetyltransferase [Nitrospiraceae bacterium]|nr:MAG: N-acetyltransferase [Nitrospiraceae bacterium]
MRIRKEKETDRDQITQLHYQVFNEPEEGTIVDNLRKNNNLTISLVYEIDGNIVGHIAYSPVYKEQEIIGLGLAPIAVLPEYQNQGIGSALIRYGNSVALSIGYKKIFVLGLPDYYSRFGFHMARKYNYFSKFDLEGDHFMIMGDDLENEAERVFVNYCTEFAI